MKFGAYFKQLRISKEVTQQQVADAINKVPMFVSNVENNKNGPFSEQDLEKISVLLNLTEYEKSGLYLHATMATGRIPHNLLDYINRNNEAFVLLETCAREGLGKEALSKILEYIREL